MQTLTPTQLLDSMRRLAAEGVPLKPRRVLFEGLLEAAGLFEKPEPIHEYVRYALRRQICKRYGDRNQFVAGYVIEPELEAKMRGESGFSVPPDVSDAVLQQLDRITKNLALGVTPPVIFVANDLRAPLARWLAGFNVSLMVLAHKELAPEFFLHTIGTIGTRARPAPQPRTTQPARGGRRVRVAA